MGQSGPCLFRPRQSGQSVSSGASVTIGKSFAALFFSFNSSAVGVWRYSDRPHLMQVWPVSWFQDFNPPHTSHVGLFIGCHKSGNGYRLGYVHSTTYHRLESTRAPAKVARPEFLP